MRSYKKKELEIKENRAKKMLTAARSTERCSPVISVLLRRSTPGAFSIGIVLRTSEDFFGDLFLLADLPFLLGATETAGATTGVTGRGRGGMITLGMMRRDDFCTGDGARATSFEEEATGPEAVRKEGESSFQTSGRGWKSSSISSDGTWDTAVATKIFSVQTVTTK